MKKQKENYQQFNQLNTSQVRYGFILYISNQRYVDKYALAYFGSMIDTYRFMYAAETRKRSDILSDLCYLIQDDDKLYRCIQSDFTKRAILNAYNAYNK